MNWIVQYSAGKSWGFQGIVCGTIFKTNRGLENFYKPLCHNGQEGGGVILEWSVWYELSPQMSRNLSCTFWFGVQFRETYFFSPGCWKLNEDKFWQDIGWLLIVKQTLSVQVQMFAICLFFLYFLFFLSFFCSFFSSFLPSSLLPFLPHSLSLTQACCCSIHWAYHIYSIFQLYYCVCLDWQDDWTLSPACSSMQIPDFSNAVLTCGGGGFMSSWCILSSLLIYWHSWITEPFTISSSLAVKIWSVSISSLEQSLAPLLLSLGSAVHCFCLVDGII